MPSANPKLEKQASTEATEPIRQAIIVVEHKIRNLEKRKGRLEQYKDIVKNGGELAAEQKTAVAKYDDVIQSLEMMRELCKQMVGIANDAAKQQKKLARKEALERQQQDISKVREVLLIQHTLMTMRMTTKVRDDFCNGTNGAVKLSDEELKYLDDLYSEVELKSESQENGLPFLQQAQKIAEHYVYIVDGKQRGVVGATYSKLKEIINSVSQSGYFDKILSVQPNIEEVTQKLAETNFTAPPEQQINEQFSNAERHIPPQAQPENLVSIQTFPVPVAAIPVVSGTSPIPAAIPVVAQPIPSIIPAPDGSYFTNAAFVPTQVQQQPQQPQQPPPPQQPPQQQPGAPAPRINDLIGLTQNANYFFLQEEEIEQEASAPEEPASEPQPHPPVTGSLITLNAHIPTQTFTNQQFAAPHMVTAQVMYTHPTQEMPHLPTFGANNPPSPIPMPPSHQNNMQFGQQNPPNFLQAQTFEMAQQQESISREKEEIREMNKNENEVVSEIELSSHTDWANSVDTSNEWNPMEQSPQSNSDSPQLQGSQTWGNDQRNNFRGRGRGRGNSNGYNNRGRVKLQNGGRGTYYRNNDGNYQNGYQQRNWNNGNDGGNGNSYNPGFKRSNGSQPRGGPRGENRGMDRGGRGGGQFRGNQRGANRPNYVPRGKPQPQN